MEVCESIFWESMVSLRTTFSTSLRDCQAIVFEKGTETMGTVGGIITMIQIIPLVGAMIPTEIALKKNFDENGRRKYTRYIHH